MEGVVKISPKYDYVLIANILEDTSKSIEKYLLGLGVLQEKIRRIIL